MAENLEPSIVDAVANVDFKVNAELATQNAVAHQNRCYGLFEASLAQQLNRMNSLDPTEAASIRTVTTAGLSEKLAELAGALGSSQIFVKTAQTTPPETG